MATGDSLFPWMAGEGMPPATLAAGLTQRNGGSTPAEQWVYAAFDGGSADEMWDLPGIMPQHYGGGGVTFTGRLTGATATTGNVRLGAAFRLLDGEDRDTAHTYDYNEVTVAAPGTSGQFTTFTIAFTSGADMDNVIAGSAFVLRLRREASDTTNDTMTGDMLLGECELRET